MPKEFARSTRVADLIQRELAGLMERDRDGSETGLITISNVDVSPDLKNAKIYVTRLGEDPATDFMKDLSDNAGHYRHHLAKQLNMRGVPKLHFVYDHKLERANRLTALIDSLSNDEQDEPDRD